MRLGGGGRGLGKTLLLLCLLGVPLLAFSGNKHGPIPIESVLTETTFDPYSGINPSPDGKWLAYDLSNSRETLAWDYPGQRFTRSGYPMWSGLSVYRMQFLDLRTGTTTSGPEGGRSWSGSWSPDSRYYAFYSDRSGVAAVWIWDRYADRLRQVSDLVPRMSFAAERPQWSPDGRMLLFKSVPRGMTLQDIEERNSGFRKKIAQQGEQSASNSDTTSVRVYRSRANSLNAGMLEQREGQRQDGPGWIDYELLADLVLVDIESGMPRRIVENGYPATFAFSPNGRSIAVSQAVRRVPDTQKTVFALEFYSVIGGLRTKLADVVPKPGAYPQFSWSPDSTRIAYFTYEGDKYDKQGCRVVNVNNAEKVDLCAPIKGKVSSISSSLLWDRMSSSVYLLDLGGSQMGAGSGRLWGVQADGSSVVGTVTIPGCSIRDIVRSPEGNKVWEADGGKMIVRTRNVVTKRDGFYAIDLSNHAVAKIGEFDAVIRSPLIALGSNHQRFSYVQESAFQGEDLWEIDVTTGQRRQLSHYSPQFDIASFGRPLLIDWKSLNGEKLQGALLLPAGYKRGERYPLVTWIYGGDFGSDALYRFGFGWGPVFNAQVLASRGYAVFYPDVPLHPGTPVQDVVSAVVPGVDKLIELGVVDPNRLAVMGQSFGGYNVLSLITQTPRFKAAVMSASAPVDLFEGYSRFKDGTSTWVGYYEQGQGGMGGHPWDRPQSYYKNSPFFYLDKVTTPVLIQRGSEDEIALGNSAVFVALKRLDKEVEFLDYEGEDHVLQKPSNVVHFWRHRLEFLATHLKRTH